jgi:hypothetical protein
MNLLRSIEITAELFSINATKYRPDMSHRKTVTKQVVAKALKETLDTQNYLRKSKDTSLILPFIGQKQSFLPRPFQNGPPHIVTINSSRITVTYCDGHILRCNIHIIASLLLCVFFSFSFCYVSLDFLLLFLFCFCS